MELLEEILEELNDAVRAGEHQPIVGIELQQRVHQVLAAGGRFEFDRGNLQHLGAVLPQPARKLARLLAGAGDDDALPE